MPCRTTLSHAVYNTHTADPYSTTFTSFFFFCFVFFGSRFFCFCSLSSLPALLYFFTWRIIIIFVICWWCRAQLIIILLCCYKCTLFALLSGLFVTYADVHANTATGCILTRFVSDLMYSMEFWCPDINHNIVWRLVYIVLISLFFCLCFVLISYLFFYLLWCPEKVSSLLRNGGLYPGIVVFTF